LRRIVIEANFFEDDAIRHTAVRPINDCCLNARPGLSGDLQLLMSAFSYRLELDER
jgi:hypothetical protein